MIDADAFVGVRRRSTKFGHMVWDWDEPGSIYHKRIFLVPITYAFEYSNGMINPHCPIRSPHGCVNNFVDSLNMASEIEL